MTVEDADMAQRIFDEEENPGFIIVKRKPFGEGSVELEIYSCAASLWYLPKKVQLRQSHEKRMEELKENLKKTSQDDRL